MRKEKKIMLKPTSLYDEASRRYDELLRIKYDKERALAKAPSGKMSIANSKKRTQFYLRATNDAKTGEYMSKSDISRLKIYAQKRYDEKVIKLVNSEIKNLETFLDRSNDVLTQIQQIYSNNPIEVKNLINPIDMTDDDYASAWISIPFIGKDIQENTPFYETTRKERVRSKSELNIANMLESKGIPYKYECPLVLQNGIVIYPDFTLLDIRNRQEIYWEHRGMMDDKEYARNSVQRIKTLMRNGICIGKNLIITEETLTNPLGTDETKTIIQEFFKN